MQSSVADKPDKKLEALPLRWFAFIAWLLCVSVLAWRHEPWADEAQAWLIAKDSSILDLFLNQLRYESTPGLWHLLLMPFAKLGAPYWTMAALSVASVAFAVWLLLFKTRLSLPLAMILPFTFWFFYYYPIVARNYSLLFPLGLLIALAYPHRFNHPWRWFLVLVLFANVSLHALLIASGIILGQLMIALPSDAPGAASYKRARLMLAFCWLVMLLGLGYALKPASDYVMIARAGIRPLKALDALFGAFAYDSLDGPWAPISIFTGFLSLFILVGLLRILAKGGVLRFTLFSTLPVLLYFCVYPPKFWHSGILVCWLVALAVIAAQLAPSFPKMRISPVTKALVALCLAFQLGWALTSSAYDLNNSYWPSKAAVQPLEARLQSGKTLDAVGWSVISVLPYLKENPFVSMRENQPYDYWVWSRANPLLNYNLEQAAQRGADCIMFQLEYDRLHPAENVLPKAPAGYQLTDVVSGFMMYKHKLIGGAWYAFYDKVVTH